MRSCSLRLVLGCPLFAVLAFGCAPRISGGTPCVLNSECAEPLACVEGRCGSECTLHQDCIRGARCVVVAEGVGRCFIDAANQCDDDTPCTYEGLTCLNRRCYGGCDDCPSDGVCVEGLCYRPEADAGVSDAGTADAATMPSREACEPLDTMPCSAAEDCESTHSAAPACRASCTQHAECAAPNLCVRTVEGSSRHCTIACDPLTSAGCLGGDSCDHLFFQIDASTYLEAWECRRTGPREAGAPCEVDQPMQCGRGLTCSSDSAGSFCRALCDIDDDTCGGGLRCDALDGVPQIGGRVFGACSPRP